MELETCKKGLHLLEEIEVEWEPIRETRCPVCGGIAYVYPRYIKCRYCDYRERLERDLLYCPQCGHQELW